MQQRLNQFLDWFSNTFAHRKGFLPLLGIFMVLLNFVLSVFIQGWLVDTNLFMHLGIIIAILGFMVAWAL